MHTTATCTNCQKRYKVDAALAGKKARCKNCGASFVIPASETADPSTDLLAGLEAAAAAESKPTPQPRAAAAPVKKPSKEAGGAKTPSRAAPPAQKAPPIPDSHSGEMDLAGDPPCGGCGKPLPESHRICTACGFNKATGQKMQGVAAAPSGAGTGAKRPAGATRGLQRGSLADDDHDYRGVRINKAYENPLFNFLDTRVPQVVTILVVLGNLLSFGAMWYRAVSAAGASVIGRLFLATLILAVYELIFIFTTLAITNMGIGMGAKIMKTELPEDQRYSRILAASMVPSFFSWVSLVVMGAGAMLAMGLNNMAARMAAILIALGVALLVFLATSFFTFLFFFRLKILESIVTYLFYVVFYIVGVVTSLLLLSAISLMLKNIINVFQ